jgi:NAD(P)-dependent dehydrogenase (short-subunit alcohol dehydrogenase family)
MSKAAVASLTQCLGRDHAHQGIRVNAVCPNEVNTPMICTGFEIRGLDADKAIGEPNASVALGRIAEPQDIVDVILFLASDASRYICGALPELNGASLHESIVADLGDPSAPEAVISHIRDAAGQLDILINNAG